MLDSDGLYGAALKQLRTAAGLSQESLAAKMTERGFRWHQATVYKAEAGSRQVTVAEAVAITDLLGVPIQLMMQGPDATRPRARVRFRAQRLLDAEYELTDAAREYEDCRNDLRTALEAASTELDEDEAGRITAVLTRSAVDVVEASKDRTDVISSVRSTQEPF